MTSKIKCKSCETELTRIAKGVYECEQCEELFTVDEKGLQKPVKDRKKLFESLQDKVKGIGAKIKELSNKYGFAVKDDDDDDESTFGIDGF